MGLELKMDPDRADTCHGLTQVFVRAKNPEGTWTNADIAELDLDSLKKWLASRDEEGKPNVGWRESVIFAMLGHTS